MDKHKDIIIFVDNANIYSIDIYAIVIGQKKTVENTYYVKIGEDKVLFGKIFPKKL